MTTKINFTKHFLTKCLAGIILVGVITLMACPAQLTYADAGNTIDTVFFGTFEDDGKGCGVYTILKTVLDILASGIGILSVLGITIVGIKYLTSGGNVAQATKAKRRLLEIVIGIIAYVTLYAIIVWLMPEFNPNFHICEKTIPSATTSKQNSTTNKQNSSSSSSSSNKTSTNSSSATTQTNKSTPKSNTGVYTYASTGRGLGKAIKISINFHPSESDFKAANGRCGRKSGDKCQAIATVTYPGKTVKYYMGRSHYVDSCEGPCRLNAFTTVMNAIKGTNYSALDVQKYLASEGQFSCLKGAKGYRTVFQHYGVKGTAYFGGKSSSQLKKIAKTALNNGQPVVMFVAHEKCPALARSHHALLLLGYDKNGYTQFIDSAGYGTSQSGKWKIDTLFDKCLSGKGIRNEYMGMQVFSF